MTLCHALLKTYGPNDVLLLASLFTMSDESLKQYYGIKYEKTSPPVPKGDTVNDTIFIFRSNHDMVLTEKPKHGFADSIVQLLQRHLPARPKVRRSRTVDEQFASAKGNKIYTLCPMYY